MGATIFVTGGTGQTGGNVCEQLIERGDHVRALVRNPDEAQALAALGVELVKGDISDPDDVLRAAAGAEAAIHCAALLGGASQDINDFKAVNMTGTTNVLDAGQKLGMRRVVALSTATFIDLTTDKEFEEAPVLANPPDDPYTVTKLAAFLEAHERAAAGEDVVTCHPGAIFGPGVVVERALHRTSFNRVLLAGLRGRISRYLAFPVTWVAGADVARGSIAALDRGVAGERYLLIGRPEDTISTAAGINRACEIAGIDHRVDDLDYRTDPERLTAEFGPTLMAIAEAAAKDARLARSSDNPTTRRLGYDPISFDDGLRAYIPWLRKIGRLT
ncbi:nucleoside-diphosphate-sugar epimerase [Mycolicibacterium sp. BK556]|uniref:NAD-dependent epimerase/dehydratase family protein n=1 Tax=unclassified Mycolicibacterium TaxID=2636767 RepID=UPI00160B800D|nr:MULTISPECIES: NAD-dependent epimerase/dehydratase family protein [unclassified Mycolicibacterium]MBB3602801.1 nucleoside-diphosphate-sugar epimerase [Mycolicibacterium sp. BK556]MBB3632996.1 nucleoside-diphosphate-sugar epimerase [Mycolicibacterium sp. BK607]